jgi:hypothetical protein
VCDSHLLHVGALTLTAAKLPYIYDFDALYAVSACILPRQYVCFLTGKTSCLSTNRLLNFEPSKRELSRLY